MQHRRRAVFAALLFLCLTGCAANTGQPVNLGELKQQLIAYEKSGAYDGDLVAIDSEAAAWIEQRSGAVSHPAIILDIDETSLSNWPALRANDFANIPDAPCLRLPQSPCGMKAWQQRAEAAAIQPTLVLFRAAKAKGVAVFFITGRDENLRVATEKNLRRAGYDDWKKLVMRPAGTTTPSAADYKTPARAAIEAEGYDIIASIGDQPSDLAGGHAERVFLLPNPFYRIP